MHELIHGSMEFDIVVKPSPTYGTYGSVFVVLGGIFIVSPSYSIHRALRCQPGVGQGTLGGGAG